MTENISALLVYDQDEPFEALKRALENQDVRIRQARTRVEVTREVNQSCPPQLIFTAPQLQDSSWDDVLGLAYSAREPAPVIVVCRTVDLKLYLDVLERGAFDFIVPPFLDADLAHLVRCATQRGPAQGEPQKRQVLAA